MDKIIKLPFISDLESRIQQNPELLQVVIGPRQVGKTTTIQEFFKDKSFSYYSADQVFNSNSDWLIEIWNKAINNSSNAKSTNTILIIDEIQKKYADRAINLKISKWHTAPAGFEYNSYLITIISDEKMLKKGFDNETKIWLKPDNILINPKSGDMTLIDPY